MTETRDRAISRIQLGRRKLRFGFKAEANRESLRVRRAAGAGDHDRVDCSIVADQLNIRIVRLSELPSTEHTNHLSHIDPSAMSAAMVRRHGRVGIWLNDSHSPERQRSNLAHEIAHVVLGHDDAPPLNEFGCRDFHADIEAEADYFGSVLLVPEVAAVAVVRTSTPLAQAADHFGASEQMMRWRINASGAYLRTRRERSRANGRKLHEHE